MKLFRSFISVFAISALLVACDDNSSSAGENSNYDCSVTNGVLVVSPKKGDSFKLGDTVTVVFGSDIDAGGFFVAYRSSVDVANEVEFETVDPGYSDGKTCLETKVVLDPEEGVKASDEAVLRVIPYSRQEKGSNSAPFKVEK